jgi:SAM-dependent MidA family methyltransferase
VNELAATASAECPALAAIIRERIESEGPITFCDFMELALYHPVHGYYQTCDPTRDYQSSPNVHPVFGACIARQLGEMWRLLDRPQRFDVLEAGAGGGRLAADVLAALRDGDPDLFDAVIYHTQDRTYPRTDGPGHFPGLPEGKVSLVTDLDADQRIEGCILSNELIDAFPVHRVRVEDGRLVELRVGLGEGDLVDVPAEPLPGVKAYFDRLGFLPGEACDAEVNLDAGPWMRRAASALNRGYLMTLDYGYPANELFQPWRKRGTLLTFFRHTSGDDPYRHIGRQDITASVDFTTIVQEGEAAGLRMLGLTKQAEFLAALGIGDALSQKPDPSRLEAHYALRRSVIELTDGAGLGRITVLVQGKDVPEARLTGLWRSDHIGG